MPDTKLMTGRDLGKAICAHFGLSADQVQSDYKIKTDLDGLASINLTVSLTPDDLSGIARAAAGDEPQSATQELKLKVDTSEVTEELETLREEAVELCRLIDENLRTIVGQASVEAIQGEALAIEPDPRLDEIVTLLRRLVGIAGAEKAGRRMMFDAVSVDGCQRGPKSGHWVDEHGIRHTDIGGQG